MNNKKQGKCHLCGKECKLTFEHLPPEKANNHRETHAIVGDTLMNHIGGIKEPWDLSGLRYKKLQRGMGNYTLCAECNNNTGNWYANDYIKFANTIGYILNNQVDLSKTEAMRIELAELYPLRIIKQILCMFASTMHPEFLDANNDLREFIQNKESTTFDIKKYRISMYAMKNQKSSWSGLMALFYDKEIKTVAYMDLYPVGFILELEPTGENFKYTTDITNMVKDCNYNTKCVLNITLNIVERNTFFLGDFRTKEEINKQVLLNKRKTISIIEEQMSNLGINKKEYKNIIQEYLENKISPGEFTVKIEKIKNSIIRGG